MARIDDGLEREANTITGSAIPDPTEKRIYKEVNGAKLGIWIWNRPAGSAVIAESFLDEHRLID